MTQTTAIICIIIGLAIGVFLLFIPTIVKKEQARQLKRFYGGLRIGDTFVDPYYSDDPFSGQYRVIEVTAKKNNYVLYEIKWLDSATDIECENYTPRKESTSAQRFLYLVKDFYKQGE